MNEEAKRIAREERSDLEIQRRASEGPTLWELDRIKSRATVQGYRIGALVGMLAVILLILVFSAFLGWPW